MTSGTLSSDCYCLTEDLQSYDAYENDYFGLDSFESYAAEEESRKRLQRIIKQEIISTATRCFRVFMGVYSRYQDLKASVDILRDRHSGLLQTIKQINELYEKADKECFCGEHTKEFDRLLGALPCYIWVQ